MEQQLGAHFVQRLEDAQMERLHRQLGALARGQTAEIRARRGTRLVFHGDSDNETNETNVANRADRARVSVVEQMAEAGEWQMPSEQPTDLPVDLTRDEPMADAAADATRTADQQLLDEMRRLASLPSHLLHEVRDTMLMLTSVVEEIILDA